MYIHCKVLQNTSSFSYTVKYGLISYPVHLDWRGVSATQITDTHHQPLLSRDKDLAYHSHPSIRAHTLSQGGAGRGKTHTPTLTLSFSHTHTFQHTEPGFMLLTQTNKTPETQYVIVSNCACKCHQREACWSAAASGSAHSCPGVQLRARWRRRRTH